MSILSLFGGGRAKAPEYPSDTLTARDGTQFTIRFFSHASLAVSVGEKYLYVDPVSGHAAYASLPKADVLLITHSHYDHLDRAAAEELLTPDKISDQDYKNNGNDSQYPFDLFCLFLVVIIQVEHLLF